MRIEMKSFTKISFKEMPWKNGGGKTTELYRHQIFGSDDFVFRLSMAKVQQDGPFSIYPEIDRHLMILKGQGCELGSGREKIELSESSAPYSFEGEKEIDCHLLGGEILDFNVMTKRTWGKSQVKVHQFNNNTLLEKDSDMTFAYSVNYETLFFLEDGDELMMDTHAKWISIHVKIYDQ